MKSSSKLSSAYVHRLKNHKGGKIHEEDLSINVRIDG